MHRTKRGAMRALLVVAVLWMLPGCKHGESAPEAPFVPLGEVIYKGGGASFSETRVVGPRVNLSRRSDGSWGGTLMDQAVDVSVNGDKVRGVHLQLNREAGPAGVIFTGQWLGRILRFEIDAEKAVIR